ncbi:hypothetical protein EON71_00545 [bacterium]|nr:MAG: hypothetical protein EON71_00545 [bacterium]
MENETISNTEKNVENSSNNMQHVAEMNKLKHRSSDDFKNKTIKPVENVENDTPNTTNQNQKILVSNQKKQSINERSNNNSTDNNKKKKPINPQHSNNLIKLNLQQRRPSDKIVTDNIQGSEETDAPEKIIEKRNNKDNVKTVTTPALVSKDISNINDKQTDKPHVDSVTNNDQTKPQLNMKDLEKHTNIKPKNYSTSKQQNSNQSTNHDNTVHANTTKIVDSSIQKNHKSKHPSPQEQANTQTNKPTLNVSRHTNGEKPINQSELNKTSKRDEYEKKGDTEEEDESDDDQEEDSEKEKEKEGEEKEEKETGEKENEDKKDKREEEKEEEEAEEENEENEEDEDEDEEELHFDYVDGKRIVISERYKNQHFPKKFTKSKKAGLEFPVGRFLKNMKNGNYSKRVAVKSAVYLSAVVQYLVNDIYNNAASETSKRGKKCVTPKHLMDSMENDKELKKLFNYVYLPQSGTLPTAIDPTEIRKPPHKKKNTQKTAKKNQKDKSIPILEQQQKGSKKRKGDEIEMELPAPVKKTKSGYRFDNNLNKKH